jgi:hypothetical protein
VKEDKKEYLTVLRNETPRPGSPVTGVQVKFFQTIFRQPFGEGKGETRLRLGASSGCLKSDRPDLPHTLLYLIDYPIGFPHEASS